MIGKLDLETEAGNEEFLKYLESARRYILKHNYSKDIEDLVQEVSERVLEKLTQNSSLKVNAGYFINTAKYVLLETWRDKTDDEKRFQAPTLDEEGNEDVRPLDTDHRLANYDIEKYRATLNECMLECFKNLSPNDQYLLWRYSFNAKKHSMDEEEPSIFENFFGTLLDSLREIREWLMGLQENHQPIDKNVRVKIHRLRKELEVCVQNCLSRKKGVD